MLTSQYSKDGLKAQIRKSKMLKHIGENMWVFSYDTGGKKQYLKWDIRSLNYKGKDWYVTSKFKTSVKIKHNKK